jgi:hypothetical protein
MDMDPYTATPVWVVFKYLESFHDDGEQARPVPRQVLRVLAKRFIEFKSGRSGSLDHAFGGQTRRQWQSITTAERNRRVALDYQRERKEAQQQPRSERTGTPSESACSKVAKLHGLADDNVRQIVRNAKTPHRDAAAVARMTPAPAMTLEKKKLPTLIMFPFEEQLKSEFFTAMPVLVIFAYLECFRDDAEQAFEVPRHILQGLAKYFNRFRSGRSGSLDEAFGGQTRRQRQCIDKTARDRGVLFDYWDAYDKARKEPKSERTGTPGECAYREVGQRHGMSQDTVKAIFMKAGKQPLRRKGRKPR